MRGPSEPASQQPATHAFPEPVSEAEQADMDRLLDVDGDAYQRWLAGDGPDPCVPSD